mmetsp:Transcript_20600/g.54949  ORF Transcript_20600/g.54949 Transcript_20600/m.54949 type:complete len:615 (+) Transcript_20600:51-1895(+)
MTAHWGGACVAAFNERNNFFKTQSAFIWGSEGHWQILQREGYPTSCLSGGGRFYFANLVSTVLSSDMGVCAPVVCSVEEIMWALIPELHYRFFYAHPQLQYAVQLREYRAFSWERAHTDFVPWVWPAAAAMLMLIMTGLFCSPRPSSRSSSLCNGSSTLPQPRARMAPPRAFALMSMTIGEVMVHTRWTSYRWHAVRSNLFALGRSMGTVSRHMLPSIQILGIAGSALCNRQENHGPLRRLRCSVGKLAVLGAELCFTSLVWAGAAQVVQPMLSVNLFAREAWLQSGWTESMVACVNDPLPDALLVGGFSGIFRISSAEEHFACPHVVTVRGEIRALALSAPLFMAGALAGPEIAMVASITSIACFLFFAEGGLQNYVEHPVAELAAVTGAVLAASTANAGGRQNPWSQVFCRLVLPGSCAGACAAASAWSADAVFASVAIAAASPLMLSLAWQVASTVWPGWLELCSLDWAARAALPALPLLVFFVEGYAEPHAKWFSPYDVFVRAAGTFAVCLAAGALLEAAWRGALVVLSYAAAIGHTLCQVRLRLSLEDASGTSLLTARVPAVPLLLLSCLAAIGVVIAIGDSKAPHQFGQVHGLAAVALKQIGMAADTV